MSDVYAPEMEDETSDLMEDQAEGENAFAEPPEEDGQKSLRRLAELASAGGNLVDLLTQHELATLGLRVVEDYQIDKTSRKEWEEKAIKAQDRAAQEKLQEKDYPWDRASNVNYPLLTVAALQFAARAYPAIVKNDEAVKVKVFGTPPESPPPDALQAAKQGDPQAQQFVMQSQQAIQRHKAKLSRAERVADYLNYKLFYELEDWEGDTDALLHHLPIVGLGYRKKWYDPETQKCCMAYVPALRLVVNQDTKTLETAPRVTEEIPDVYPYQIEGRMRSGVYRECVLPPVTGDDDQAPRLLLEQHRMHDLDGDGLAEPYVVTVDHETREVLRVEAAFTLKGAKMGGEPGEEKVVGFDRWMPYTKYEFFPDLKGRFHSVGFGHLLDQISEVVNTSINQMIDAGHAQVAGGGFISASTRLQGAGKTTNVRFRPGEYKVVNLPPGQLQSSIYERTWPGASTVMFQILDLMLGAAKDITSTKDVLTGEANSTAPVGTTLALIEQGLQVFSSIYKRIYRGLKHEFRGLYEDIAAHGDAEDYLEVLDDPEANFEADFRQDGKDILPVSDPSVSTKMQAMGKAQLLMGLLGKGVNDRVVLKRALEAFDIDDPEELLPEPQPPSPELAAKAEKDAAQAENYRADAQKTKAETFQIVSDHALALGADPGGVPGMAGPSGDPMGVPGGDGGFGGPAQGMA